MIDRNDTGSQHDTVFALLPWWVNNTLESSEHRLVGEHVKTCQQCQQETEFLQNSIHALQDADQLSDPERSDVDQSFLAVMQRIDAQEQDGTTTLDNHVASSGDGVRRSKTLAGFYDWLSSLFSRQLIPVAAMTVVVAVSGALWWQTSYQDDYSVLSSSTSSPGALQLSVRFAHEPELAEAEELLRELMPDPDALVRVVSAGSGQYFLDFSDVTTAVQLSAFVKALQAEKVIDHVELQVAN